MQDYVPSSPMQKINWYVEYNGTSATMSYRYPCTAQGNLTHVKVGLHGNRSTGAATYTSKLALEYPSGTITPMYFSGVRTATVPTEGKLYSDALAVPGGPIPHGADYWIRGYASGTRWPQHVWSPDIGIATASGDVVDGGSTTIQGNNSPWPQEVLGYTGFPRPLIVSIGDSYGTFESNGTTQNRKKGPPLNEAFSEFGQVGCYCWNEGASYGIFYPTSQIHSLHVQPILSAIDIVLVGFAWNDLHPSDVTLQSMKDRMTAIYDIFAGKEVWAMPSVGPDTTSTDSWATVTNQTRTSWWSTIRKAFMDWLIATPPASVTRVIDVRSLLESAPADGTNGGYWPPFSTGDGVHPLATGYTRMKHACYPIVQHANNMCAVSAAKASILSSTTLLGSAGTLSTAKVMQSAGGNLLTTDVRSDTATGAAAGGTLNINNDNPRTVSRIGIGI